MDVLNLIGAYPFSESTPVQNDMREFDSACESLEQIIETERSMHGYQQFRNAEAPQVALESIQEVVTNFVCRELGTESGSELTLNVVCAGFGCTPEMLGLGTEAETADETGKPSKGRALLNKIKLGGKAAANVVGAGWTRMVEGVKSLLGLTMVASTAFERIEKSTTDALARLNSIQNVNALADVQVEGVNVEEFKGSVEHYKSLIATLEKVNKAKGGESSTVVNAIYSSLPKLLGITGSSDGELLAAAKQLRGTAKEKAVNLKNKTTYAGAEGLKVVKNALTTLNKTAQAMKSTADYRDLISSLKGMKKGLTPEDAAKLKVITQVLNYYIKASSDVLRSLTKGADSLLKVSKRFEKLTGSSKSKEMVASTESFQADSLMASLKAMSAGMESYGYDLGVANYEAATESDSYEPMEDGLECIMIALDAFDYTESQLEAFVNEKREAAIESQIAMLKEYGEEHGIEAEDLTFAMMNGISLMAGTEEEKKEEAKDEEGFFKKVKRKIPEAWEWVCKKAREFLTWLSGKSRVFGSMEVAFKKLITWIKNKFNIAKGKLSEFLHKIPGYDSLEAWVLGCVANLKIKFYCIKAYFKNPKAYIENAQKRDQLISMLTNDTLQLSSLKGGVVNSLLDKADTQYDNLVDSIEDLPDELKAVMKLSKDDSVNKAIMKAKDLADLYGGADKVPGLTKLGAAIEKAKGFCSKHWSELMKKLAEMIQKIKDFFKKDDKKEEKK